MKATLIVNMILALFLTATQTWAADEKAEGSEEAAPQKVDMKNIENKYWQPSDQSYTVVQSRTYAKEKKIGVSLMPGLLMLDDWSTGFSLDAAVSYYFSERWGVELQGTFYSLDDNDFVDEIASKGGQPDHGKATNFMGVFARWVPFYSKMSFMGTKVVYFDMSLGLGAGLLSYEQQLTDGTTSGRDTKSASSPSVAFDVSQTYFINPKLALRVDYKMKFYNEEVLAYNTKPGGINKGDKLRDDFSNVTTLNLGLTYLF